MIDLRYVDIENFMGIEKFSLDLEDSGLKGSLIFLLGHNGAGKSSVLEAIFYALTSSTERMGRTKESTKTSASILRHGASHGYVEVHFIGVDGALYKVRRTFLRKGGKLVTRASIRRREKGKWTVLKGVSDKEKDVNAVLPKLLGIQGEYKDVLRATFLIMQGRIDTMLMDTSPVDVLSQSGVIPYKEEDIKAIIKSRQEKLRIQIEHVNKNVENSMRSLEKEVNLAIEEFLSIYDPTIMKRWEDVESNAMARKVASDSTYLLNKLADTIESYMPVFEGLRRLEDLSYRLEKAEKELEDTIRQKKEIEEKIRKQDEIIRESTTILSQWHIKSSLKDAVFSVSTLKEEGLSPELMRIYSSMNPINRSEYERLFSQYYSNVDSRLIAKVRGVYVHLYHLFKDKDISYKDKLMKQVSQRKALLRELKTLKTDVENLKRRVSLLKVEIQELQEKKAKSHEEVKNLYSHYEQYKVFKDYMDDLREIARLSKEIDSISSVWKDKSIPDIDYITERYKWLDKVYGEIISIKIDLEKIGDVDDERPNIDSMENWIRDYATYMARRDGICPVDGKPVEKDDTASRPIPSADVVRSVALLQVDDMRRKRDNLIDKLRQLTGFSDVGKALEWIKEQKKEVKEMEELALRYRDDLVRLEQKKKERERLVNNLPVKIKVEKVDMSWVKWLANVFKGYEEMSSYKEKVQALLSEKERMLAQYWEELNVKVEKLQSVEEDLQDIPENIDLMYNMFDDYLYMKEYHRVFARENSREVTYYRGVREDAQKVVAVYDALYQIKDLVGSPLFNIWIKKNRGFPYPDEVEMINGYIKRLRGTSSITSRDDFEDIYVHIDELATAITNLEMAENERDRLNMELSVLVGKIEQLRENVNTLKSEIEKIKRGIRDIPEIIKTITDSKNPEAVLVRIRDMADRIREHVNSVSSSMESLEKLRYKERVYDFISRKLLSHFYHWYVDKIMGTFKDRLSSNLLMLSGRYTVCRLDKNSGIEVYDDWYKTTRPVRMLSGGERTMLGLAFIFALADTVAGSGGHRTFFIDEGFSALDAKRKEELRPVLENIISASGHTIFIITHDETILSSAPPESPVIRINKGKIEGDISTAQSEMVGKEVIFSGDRESDEFSLLDNLM